MGALTLKSLAFYLRNWDTEKSESIDPTDGFGSSTRVYVNNSQIVQIEPEYDIYTFNTWLSDKGRQFFDSMSWSKSINSNSWIKITRSIIKVIYLSDHCNKQINKKSFFTIIFENVSLEVLSLLIIINQNYSFVNIKRAENFDINNNLESFFQTGLTTNNRIKLSNSSMCLLISTNPRYEGYILNLSLRQRYFKGNFKCFSVGSLINLTFPVSFLNSNVSSIKSITEGKNLICQSLKISKNPLILYNNELLKRSDGKSVVKIIQVLKYLNIFNNSWNNISCFSSTISETGNQSIAKFLPVKKADLYHFSILYLLNVNIDKFSNLKQITNFKLLNLENKFFNLNKLVLDQSYENFQNFDLFNKNLKDKKTNYLFIPASIFYENEETFINTEGLIKRTSKIIFRKKTKNHWQLLRKFLKLIKTCVTFYTLKDNQLVAVDLKNLSRFKNFIYFNYLATQSLANINFYLFTRTNYFYILNNKFKINQQKIVNTKLKYWLDDFYINGRDEYSKNSLIMTNCSKILRLQNSNFF